MVEDASSQKAHAGKTTINIRGRLTCTASMYLSESKCESHISSTGSRHRAFHWTDTQPSPVPLHGSRPRGGSLRCIPGTKLAGIVPQRMSEEEMPPRTLHVENSQRCAAPQQAHPQHDILGLQPADSMSFFESLPCRNMAHTAECAGESKHKDRNDDGATALISVHAWPLLSARNLPRRVLSDCSSEGLDLIHSA